MKRQGMAAEFVEITLDEVEKVLKRGARIMRPKRGVHQGIVYYDLSLSGRCGIRVWTSIPERRGVGKDVGESAIRIQLVDLSNGRPLKKGKAPIVKRTQGWADNLRARIRDARVEYKDKQEYWESRAGGEPEGISDKQLGMVRGLVNQLKDLGWTDDDFDGVAKTLGVTNNVPDYSKAQASDFISALSDKLEEAKKTKALATPEPEVKPSRAPERRPDSDVVTFTKLRSGDWGVRGYNLVEGDRVTVVKKNGQRVPLVVGRVLTTFDDGVCLATIAREAGERFASDENDEPGYDRTTPT